MVCRPAWPQQVKITAKHVKGCNYMDVHCLAWQVESNDYVILLIVLQG